MKFVFITDCFESSALALYMKVIEKADVKVHVRDRNYYKILEGMIDKEEDYVQFMGQEGNIFITDNAECGKIADSLRAKGEKVVGGSVISDKLENDRVYGMNVMKEAGIQVPPCTPFKGHDAFDKAIDFIKKKPGRYVLKQSGNLAKDLNTVGKFEKGEDVIEKLSDFKHSWTSDIDFVLQEFKEGHEVGCSAWFNGKDWIRDKTGEIIWEINWEHKKKSEGDTGVSTGETCTLSYRSHKDKRLGKELKKMTEYFQAMKYIGNTDINFIVEEKTDIAWGLEFSNRFGYPYLNLQQESLKTKWSELFEMLTTGGNGIDYDPRWAVVVVVQVPPFPFESTKDNNNAKGQRIYFLEDGKWTGKDEFDTEKIKHTHLYEVRFDKESKHFLCSGDTGYLMTVTAQADSVKAANSKALKYLKDNVYSSNMDWRKDCGVNKRVTEAIEYLSKHDWF